MTEDNLKEKFVKEMEKQSAAAEVDNVDARACSSDKFSGIEYTFEGRYVPVKPVLDVVDETEGKLIEFIAHVDDHKCALIVFVADVPSELKGHTFV